MRISPTTPIELFMNKPDKKDAALVCAQNLNRSCKSQILRETVPKTLAQSS